MLIVVLSRAPEYISFANLRRMHINMNQNAYE